MKPLTQITSRFILTLAFLEVAFPQTAQVAGTITDSTDARVPEAVLTVRSVHTGVERSARTNAEGYYSFPRLSPGAYGLTILKIDETARLDVGIAVGEVSQAVSVVKETPMVTSDSGALKPVIDQRRIVDLPLNRRKAEELVFLGAGTVHDRCNGGTYLYGSSIAPDTPTLAFTLPGATLSSPSVGRILSAGDPRILQFGLKVIF